MKGEPCLLVKTAPELFVKSDFVNRQMTSRLVSNLQKALKANRLAGVRFEKGKARITIRGSNLEKTKAVLKTIFGIHSVALADFFPQTDLEIVVQKAVETGRKNIKRGDSFAIDCSRSGNQSYSSKDVEVKAGAELLKKIPGITVDLDAPKKTVFVNVVSNGFFIFSSIERGLGGLPVGSQGKIGFFLGNTKNEEKAIWLLLKRGCTVVPVLKKKGYSAILKKMERWNSFQKFETIPEKELVAQVKKKNLLALANADSVLSEKEIEKIKKTGSKWEWPVLRPLLGLPLKYVKLGVP